MKKKLLIASITGFLCLILGLIMTGIGFFSGGVDQLSNVVKPTYKEQSYKQLDSVLINSGWERSIRIIESEDSDYHVRYHDFEKGFQLPFQVTENDGELILDSIVSDFKISGIMQFLAENVATRNYENLEVNIEIPKGKTLKRLESGTNGELSIEGIHIEQVSLYGSTSIIQSTIENGSINTDYGNIYVEDSTLKSITVTGYASSFHISDSQLENTEWDAYDRMDTTNITVIGENSFTGNEEYPHTNARINLSEKSQKEALLTAELSIDKRKLFYYGESNLTDEEIESIIQEDANLQEQLKEIGIFPEGVYKDQTVTVEDTKQTFTSGKKDSKNKLTITSTNGVIQLGKEWSP